MKKKFWTTAAWTVVMFWPSFILWYMGTPLVREYIQMSMFALSPIMIIVLVMIWRTTKE